MQHSTESERKPPPGAVNTLPAMEIVPTGKAVGAEIRGVDLSQPIPDDLRAALKQAWLDHLVLLFRGQDINQKNYLNAASVFGTPQVGGARAYYEKTGRVGSLIESEYPEVSILSNLGPDGKPTKENDGLGSLEVVWHSDNSYIDTPPAGSCLYAVEVPTHSGNTSFNNQYLAYETLPENLKRAIEGKRSKQDASRNSAGVLRPGVTKPERPEDVPGPMHPLVRVHSETRRKALYLGRRRIYPSQFIEGLSEEESEALLDKLWAHATQDKFKWTHAWKVGDLLVWDNRCAMHYRDPVDHTQRRVMLRTQFQGEVPIPA